MTIYVFILLIPILLLFHGQYSHQQTATKIFDIFNLTKIPSSLHPHQYCQRDRNILEGIQQSDKITIKNIAIFLDDQCLVDFFNLDETLKMIVNDKIMLMFVLRNISGNTVVQLKNNNGNSVSHFHRNNLIQKYYLLRLWQNQAIVKSDSNRNNGTITREKVHHNKKLTRFQQMQTMKNNAKINSLIKNNGGDIHDIFKIEDIKLGTDASIFFLLKNVNNLEQIFDIIGKFPNLVKIIFTYGDCWESEVAYKEKIRIFMERQWATKRVLFIYFIPFCLRQYLTDLSSWKCLINTIYVYNPFITPSIVENYEPSSIQWGQVEKFQFDSLTSTEMSNILMTVNHDNMNNDDGKIVDYPSDDDKAETGNTLHSLKTVTAINSSEIFTHRSTNINFPLRTKHLTLNGIPLKIVFFATTMAFLKMNSEILRKQLSAAALENPFNSTDSYFGVDIEVLMELSRRMNFTPRIGKTSDGKDYGFRKPDGTFNGALGDVIYNRAEFIMNGFFVKDYETRLLEFSVAPYQDELCIITRTADLIPDGLLIFRCFSLNVWLAMIFTMFVTSVFFYWFEKIAASIFNLISTFNISDNFHKIEQPSDVRNRLLGNISLNLHAPCRIIAVLLNAPVGGIGTSAHERLFVSICLLWGLNLSGAFQGSLANVYTTPTSYPNIDSLEALDRSGIPIAVRHAGLIVDVFGSEKPGTPLGNLRARMIPTEDDLINDRIAMKGDVVALDRSLIFTRKSQENIRPDGVPRLHLVKQCPRSYRLAYLFPKSSVFLETANHHFSLFLESGLIKKWLTDALFYFELQTGFINRNYIHNNKIILTLSHLQIAFYILIIGSFLSFIIFLIELFYT